MLISEALETTKRIYSQMNERNLVQKVGADAYQIWRAKGENIISFLDGLKPEYRDKCWKWLLTIGVQNLDQIRRMYAILSVLYAKKDQFPPNLKSILSRHNNFAVTISILGKQLLDSFTQWADQSLSETERQMAQGSYIMNFSAIAPVKPVQKTLPDRNTVKRAGYVPSSGRFAAPQPSIRKPPLPPQSRVRPQTLSHPAIRMNNGRTQENKPKNGARTMDELRKMFGS